MSFKLTQYFLCYFFLCCFQLQLSAQSNEVYETIVTRLALPELSVFSAKLEQTQQRFEKLTSLEGEVLEKKRALVGAGFAVSEKKITLLEKELKTIQLTKADVEKELQSIKSKVVAYQNEYNKLIEQLEGKEIDLNSIATLETDLKQFEKLRSTLTTLQGLEIGSAEYEPLKEEAMKLASGYHFLDPSKVLPTEYLEMIPTLETSLLTQSPKEVTKALTNKKVGNVIEHNASGYAEMELIEKAKLKDVFFTEMNFSLLNADQNYLNFSPVLGYVLTKNISVGVGGVFENVMQREGKVHSSLQGKVMMRYSISSAFSLQAESLLSKQSRAFTPSYSLGGNLNLSKQLDIPVNIGMFRSISDNSIYDLANPWRMRLGLLF